MIIEAIGKTISQLRKEKGVTQEELSKAIKVTAQACSKWENGGLPDIELLPKIADFFEVSIDTLFGRTITDYSDIRKALASQIIETKQEERFKTVFELCWDIERLLFGNIPEDGSVKDYQNTIAENDQIYSSIMSDHGYTRMGIANRLQYFLIVPETMNTENAFFNGIDYIELFKDFSDKIVFDTILMLNKRENGKAFTLNLLTKNLEMDNNKALEVIKILHRYGLIKNTQIEMDDVTQEVYTFVPTPSFMALLIFAHEIIDKPNHFSYFSASRTKPYLYEN